MIDLITRAQALGNPIFASYIHSWQSRFDPAKDPYMTDPGVYYDEKIDGERFFDKDEIDVIHKCESDEYERLRDHIDPIERTYQGELLYSLPFKDILVYSVEMGIVLQHLSERLNSKLTFLMDYSIPWLFQKNEFEPVRKALDYFRQIGVSENFVGGIQADEEELEELTANLFWLSRCNASLPYCSFTSNEDQFVGHLCKYGNLHLHSYSEHIKTNLEHFAQTNGLIKIEECFQKFNDTNVIEGRELKIE